MSPEGWLLVAAIVLVLVAGWCAGAQAALARLSAADPGAPLGATGRRAGSLRAVLADLPPYSTLLSLLRVSCEVCAAVLVTQAFVHWFGGGWQAFLPAAGVVLVARLALVGVGPRVMSRQRAERTAATAAGLLYPLGRALGPLPGLLAAASSALPIGRRNSDDELANRADLRGLVDLMERKPVIEPGEREMVRSVFELGDTIVREVMVPRTDMVFIERDKTLGQALSLALRSGFSRIPVVGENEDDVVGIAYLKDIVARDHEHPGSERTPVTRVMRPATYVPESKPVDQLLRQMQSQRIHVAVVIDEYGGTAGLVTIEDILEEIVGEIADEYDNERAPVEWLTPGAAARVTARLPVTELEELFAVDIDAEDVETVGGLLAHELGRVPIAGAAATVQGLRLTAENPSGRRNRLGTVLVERTDARGQAP